MAYFRGRTYIWSDGERLHLWVHDGADVWEETQWAADYDEANDAYIRHHGYESAAAVAIPEETINSFVLMRFAELIASGSAMETFEAALRERGNFGAGALCTHADELREAIGELTTKVQSKTSASVK